MSAWLAWRLESKSLDTHVYSPACYRRAGPGDPRAARRQSPKLSSPGLTRRPSSQARSRPVGCVTRESGTHRRCSYLDVALGRRVDPGSSPGTAMTSEGMTRRLERAAATRGCDPALLRLSPFDFSRIYSYIDCVLAHGAVRVRAVREQGAVLRVLHRARRWELPGDPESAPVRH